MENKLLGINRQMFLSVSPEETYSTKEVRGLSVKTRECIFSDEHHYGSDFDITLLNLTYAQYTYKNCLSECRASTIKAKCQCIPYYFPQKGYYLILIIKSPFLVETTRFSANQLNLVSQWFLSRGVWWNFESLLTTSLFFSRHESLQPEGHQMLKGTRVWVFTFFFYSLCFLQSFPRLTNVLNRPNSSKLRRRGLRTGSNQ